MPAAENTTGNSNKTELEEELVGKEEEVKDYLPTYLFSPLLLCRE